MIENPLYTAMMADKVAVPRAILGAACYIIRHSAQADSETAKAVRAFAYADGIKQLPLGDVPDPARELAEALVKGGFMSTEPAPTQGFERARRLVIGFESGDDADEAMQALARFLRDYGSYRADGGTA